MKTFTELPLLPEIQKSLENLGFTTPTEIQAKTIPLLIEAKRDIHAQAQTGTGKTLAFGIPLLQAIDPTKKAVQGLVIAPTRELVLQIYEALREVSRGSKIMIEPVYGGMPIERQIRAIKQGAQIIIGTPGRLNDHLRRRTMNLKNLKVLVLDEADIMVDMGFKQEIDTILDHAPSDRQIWLFSATVMPGIKQLIKSHMNNVVTVKSDQKSVASAQVSQYFCVVPKRKRVEALTRFIESAPDFYGIIFCQTKMFTSELMELLVSKGFRANCLHGDMSQALRNKVIKGFKNKDFNILVATDVAARGIDVSDLTHVINFSIPREKESYVHRIGRTGRAGKEGTAILFLAKSEIHKIKYLEKLTGMSMHEIPIPPLDAIIKAKMTAVSDFIEQAKISRTKRESVSKALNELITSFTDEEIRHSFAVALEDRFFKDIINEDFGDVRSSGGSVPEEICLMLGKDDGISEDQILDYLHATCGLLPQQVSKVRVLPNKTFISIPEDKLRETLKVMIDNPIVKKKHRVYLVEDIYKPSDRRSGGRGGRSSSGRGSDRFRGDRKRSGKRPMHQRSDRKKRR